jgi:hypothetical protein
MVEGHDHGDGHLRGVFGGVARVIWEGTEVAESVAVMERKRIAGFRCVMSELWYLLRGIDRSLSLVA